MPNKIPTNELAAIAWLRTIPGIPSDKVNTKRPGDNSLIAPSGYLTVRTVGGSSDLHLPRRSPVVQVTAWACHTNTDSNREPPWADANQLLEVIREFCWDEQYNFKGVIPTRSGYDSVCVQSAYPITEPVKVPGDDARMAQYTMDVQINWTRRKI